MRRLQLNNTHLTFFKTMDARRAPSTWEITKGATPDGAIPQKVSVSILAKVTAGLAKEVEDVNQ